jgi:hypothetical protein
MNTFVLVAAGTGHGLRASRAIRFLKRFSRCDIVVITSEEPALIAHDQVIRAPICSHWSGTFASRYIKTSLHRLLKPSAGRFCYLDNDILAVHPDCDQVFRQQFGPISFATDQDMTVRSFARWALREPRQRALSEVISEKFGVPVDPLWRIWNGGLFVFNDESAAFMDLWHRYTLINLTDPIFLPRDQIALIAAAWEMRLQHQRRIPSEYNWVVTHPLRWHPLLFHNKAFRRSDGTDIKFLHVLSGSEGRESDDAETLLLSPGAAHLISDGNA